MVHPKIGIYDTGKRIHKISSFMQLPLVHEAKSVDEESL